MQVFSDTSGKGSALERTTLPTTRRPHTPDNNDKADMEGSSSNNYHDKPSGGPDSPPSLLSTRDREAFALLLVLCKHALIHDGAC